MATANILPDGDVTANWDTTEPDPPTTHYTSIDEGTTSPTDTEYNETVTNTDIDRVTLGAVPADVGTVTSITVNIRARITDASPGTSVIRLRLYHTTSTEVGTYKDVTIADLGVSGDLNTVTETWSGVSLTQAQANTLELSMEFRTAA